MRTSRLKELVWEVLATSHRDDEGKVRVMHPARYEQATRDLYPVLRRFIAQAVQPVLARTTQDFDEHVRDITTHVMVTTIYYLNDPKGTRRYIQRAAHNLAVNVLEKIAPTIRVFREVVSLEEWPEDSNPDEIKELYDDHGFDKVEVRRVKDGWSICGYMRRIHTTGYDDVAEGTPSPTFDWDYLATCVASVPLGPVYEFHRQLAVSVTRHLEEIAAEGGRSPSSTKMIRRALLRYKGSAPHHEVFLVESILRTGYRMYRAAYPLLPEVPPYAIMERADD